jgi:putative SOS response-associated peptidase YedK
MHTYISLGIGVAQLLMSPIHDRMPAILSPQDYDEWLDRGEVESAHSLAPPLF